MAVVEPAVNEGIQNVDAGCCSPLKETLNRSRLISGQSSGKQHTDDEHLAGCLAADQGGKHDECSLRGIEARDLRRKSKVPWPRPVGAEQIAPDKPRSCHNE